MQLVSSLQTAQNCRMEKLGSTIIFLGFWLNAALVAHVVHMFIFATGGGETGQVPYSMAALACVGPPLGLVAIVIAVCRHDRQRKSPRADGGPRSG